MDLGGGNEISSATSKAGLAVLAICLGNALGSLDTAIQPIWVAAFMKSGALSLSNIGWIGSGELFLIAGSTFAVSAVAQRFNPRKVAIVAAVLVAIANGIAALPHFQALILGRLLSGVGTGSLLAASIGIAARGQNAQRVLALMQLVVLLMISFIYFASPSLVIRFGTAGLFGLVSAIGVVTVVAFFAVGPQPRIQSVQLSHKPPQGWVAPLMGCLAMVCVAAGMTTVGTFTITIGLGLGFSARAMGNVLAVAVPTAMLGPMFAHWLGERAGLLGPVLLGLIVIAAGFFFVINAASPVLMCIYLAVQGMGAFFYVSYAMALVSRLDPSGRFAGAAPAFIMIGASVGPKLGSEIVGIASFQLLAAVGTSSICAGMLLFVLAGKLGGPLPVRMAAMGRQ